MKLRALACCLCVLPAFAGCGSSEPKKNPALIDSIDLIELATEKSEEDPKTLVEVKLGEFKITHASNVPETPVNVKFTVYGLLPEKKKEEFDASIDKHKQRMRDAVISLVHKTDFEALNDPSLDGLKSELIVAINQSLETNAVKDLVFSAFSIERG